MAELQLARFRPDIAALNTKYTDDVSNVLCSAIGYIPYKKLVAFTTALTYQPLGAFKAVDSTGGIHIFAGTATKLYKLNNTTLAWDHVSKLAADQATNGVFAADVSWTKGAGWTIAAGVATATAVANGVALSQAQALTVGTIYQIIYTVSSRSAGGVTPRFTGGTTVNGTTVSANGTYTQYLTAVTGNTTFGFVASGTTTLNIDNVTIKALANYGATVNERWRFAQYGDYVVAVNVNDAPQVYQLAVSSNYADLAGSPPHAGEVKVWGDFLALMRISGTPNRVHWSGLDDITQWTPGTNSCDFQDFPDGGDVQGSTEATNPIVFQEQAIRFGTFVPGSEEVFTFTKVHDKKGAPAPYSICSRGAYAFFVDNGSFNQIGADGQVIPIGLEKIDRTVFTTIQGPTLVAIMGEIDPVYNRVYFLVRYSSTTDAFDRILIYDWGVQEWSQADANVFLFLSAATIGTTLEGLDALYSTLESVPFSLDSPVWQGGAPIMAAFDSTYKLGFYSGTAAEAMMTTQEFGQIDGSMTRITETYPVIDTNSFYISYGTRNKRGDSVVWSAESQPSSNTGMVRKNTRARFIRKKLRVPADTDWTEAQAVGNNGTKAGLR